MDVYRHPGGQIGCVAGQGQLHVQAVAGLQRAGCGDPVAALDGVFGDAGQIQRAALTRPALIAGAVVGMQAAYPNHRAAAAVHQGVAYVYSTREDGAGHDRTLARQSKHAVHGQTEQAGIRALREAPGLRPQIIA